MTEKEKSDYLYDGILLDLENKTFETWYNYQYDHITQKKARQAAFRKELITRLTRLHTIYARLELFETLEKLEEWISSEI
jgi:hypothetical protein